MPQNPAIEPLIQSAAARGLCWLCIGARRSAGTGGGSHRPSPRACPAPSARCGGAASGKPHRARIAPAMTICRSTDSGRMCKIGKNPQGAGRHGIPPSGTDAARPLAAHPSGDLPGDHGPFRPRPGLAACGGVDWGAG